MLISKRNVLNAIDQEPLLDAGGFGEHRDPSCAVCAVGAVLRKVNAPRDASEYAVGRCYTASDYQDEKTFMEAPPLGQISAAFEYAVETTMKKDGWPREAAIEMGRFHAMLIAEAFCPSQVEVNIPTLRAVKQPRAGRAR